jgi:hypothetical protein
MTIRAGGEAYQFQARANSSWDPAGTAIVRRSPFRLPGTFATHASAAACDLPRALAVQLQNPATEVEVIVEPLRGRHCAVLFALDPHRRDDPRLAAELAAADLVVAEDEDAARLVGERVSHGPVRVDGRVLVLASRELPGQTVAGALREVDVETVGLPAALAAAAASPSRAALHVLAGGGDPRARLRDAPADARLVVPVEADELDGLLEFAAQSRGTPGALVCQQYAPPVRVVAGTRTALASMDTVHVCFEPAPPSEALDPRVRTAISGLLADGVPTKVAARALAELTGWPRSRAYEYVLDQAKRGLHA